MVATQDEFAGRHIGPRPADLADMLRVVRAASLDELIDETVPGAIRTARALELAPPLSEYDVLCELRRLGGRNRPVHAYIGMGYAESILPPVIQRNILENPGWYTAYTPYQAEISQGRLEALLNFQTITVVRTRAAALGVEVVVGDHATFAFDPRLFGALVQYPTTDGKIFDYRG